MLSDRFTKGGDNLLHGYSTNLNVIGVKVRYESLVCFSNAIRVYATYDLLLQKLDMPPPAE